MLRTWTYAGRNVWHYTEMKKKLAGVQKVNDEWYWSAGTKQGKARDLREAQELALKALKDAGD